MISMDTPPAYDSLLKQLDALLTGRWLTDLANTGAFLMAEIPRLNWVGFYLLNARGDQLELGPFQGKPACTEIALSRGVCGQAARLRQTVVVDDVHTFPDHIACDANSRSELVVPLVVNNKLLGVLDVDSPEVARFDPQLKIFFESAAKIFLTKQSSTAIV